jgi:hypothetical protein
MTRCTGILALLCLVAAPAVDGQPLYVGTVWGDPAAAPAQRGDTSAIAGIAVMAREHDVVLTLWEPPVSNCEDVERSQLFPPSPGMLQTMPTAGGAVVCQGGRTLSLAASDAVLLADSIEAVARSVASHAGERTAQLVTNPTPRGSYRSATTIRYTRASGDAHGAAHRLAFGAREFRRADADPGPMLQLARFLREAAHAAEIGGARSVN